MTRRSETAFTPRRHRIGLEGIGPLGLVRILMGVAGLGVRVLWRLHRMERKREKAATTFEKELVRQGMTKERAALLRSVYEAEAFPEMSFGRLMGNGS